MKKNIIILIVFIGVIVAWSYLDLGKKEPINEITDCGDDLSCFIEEAKNCNLAKTNYTATIKMFGIEYIVVLFFEIRGVESDKCLFYTRTEKIDFKFGNDLVQEMLDKGLTGQDIQQQEQEFNNLAKDQGKPIRACSSDTNDLTEDQETQPGLSGSIKDQEGLAKICKFNISDLTEMLIRWERGSFFGGDCELAAESCIEE